MSEIVENGGSWYPLTYAASTLAVFATYYIFNVPHKPKIYSSNNVLRNFLDQHVTCLKAKFWPAWFSWEGRLQSVLGLNLRVANTIQLAYKREILSLKDGGQLAVDILHEKSQNAQENERLVVLLLPGLTSSSDESYVKSLAMTVTDAGATIAILNNRGLGGVPLITPRTYCATNTEDLREVISHLKTKFPNTRFLALGTSLGGMTLCRYLINWPEEAKETFVAAMVISICWDPMVGNASLQTPFLNKYLVNYTLTSNLQEVARKHLPVLMARKDCWDFEKVFSVRTISEFDHYFTAPQFGYQSWEEYYRAAQITPEVYKFSIPVFGLNAEDDPMQPGADLPIKEAELEGSKLALIVTERGGHLGFIEGALPLRKPFHFMERVVAQFVEAIKFHHQDLEGYDKVVELENPNNNPEQGSIIISPPIPT